MAIVASRPARVGQRRDLIFRVRAAEGDADLAASLSVYNDVFPRDAVSLDEAKSFYASLPAYLELLAEVDDETVGSGIGALRPTDPGLALAIVTVRPSVRGHGIGSALFEEIRRWAAEHGSKGLETWVNEGDEASLAWARRRGFEAHAHEAGLELELATAPAVEVSPPDGIEIVSLADRPELADGMYEVASEAIPDVPGDEDYVMPPRAEFVERQLNGVDALVEGTFVALAGDEVVAYARLRPAGARPGVALHGVTAVKRAWRRRGIAGALKRAQIAWATGAGYERLATANELRNEPIRRLNERLGYRPQPGRITLRAPVRPSRPCS